MKEEWKNIEGYNNLYEVSNLGSIRIIENKELLHQSNTENEYKIVRLMLGDKKVGRVAHKFIALAFIPNSENKPEVNHLDLDKRNNKLNNLEWCTHKDNCLHAHQVYAAIGKPIGYWNKGRKFPRPTKLINP